MMNLQEAFSKLNMMESGEYELLDQEQKDAMKDFLDDDSTEAEDTDIIDPQAEDESDLQDSYVGKIIVQCPVCKSLIYKTKEELDEEGSDPQSCPYCFSVENFDLIGKIVPIEDETAPEEEEEEAEVESSEVEESLKKNIKEDLETVTIETENDVIKVSAEEKDSCPECEEKAEEKAIVSDEQEEPEHEEAEVIAPLEDGIDVDEIDEESLDDFAESLLRNKYENIVSYKTSKIKDCGRYAIAEGVVTLKSGKKRLTEFRLRPSKLNKKKSGSCLVENLQLKARGVAKFYLK